MDLTGEYRIPAARSAVWEALNNLELLRAAIPGCESLEKASETEMTAKVAIKIGPVSAKFSGKVTLSELDPPRGYRITGEGQGGAAGFAKGTAHVDLEEDGTDATVLRYRADASVGGKMAQIGSRLVQGAARKTADEFFGRFSELVGGGAGSAPDRVPENATPATPRETAPPALIAADGTLRPPVPASAPHHGGLSAWAWIGGLVVIVALLMAWFAFAS